MEEFPVTQSAESTESAAPSSSSPAVPGFARDARLVLRIEGDLDLNSVVQFRDGVFTAIGARPVVLLLDLSGVPFADTAGLSALITVARVARRVDVDLAIHPHPNLRRLLEMLGMVPQFHLVGNEVIEGGVEKLITVSE